MATNAFNVRFQLVEDDERFPNDGATCWYADLENVGHYYQRPVGAIDPNLYQPLMKRPKLMYVDKVEYHAVCEQCYEEHRDRIEWSGNKDTDDPHWRHKSRLYLMNHTEKYGWCEFCDPVFGNQAVVRVVIHEELNVQEEKITLAEVEERNACNLQEANFVDDFYHTSIKRCARVMCALLPYPHEWFYHNISKDGVVTFRHIISGNLLRVNPREKVLY